MKKIIVWHNLKTNTYYFKIVNGYYANYHVGYKNSYNHVVILMIDLYKDIYYKPPFLKKVLTKYISFLQRINKKL